MSKETEGSGMLLAESYDLYRNGQFFATLDPIAFHAWTETVRDILINETKDPMIWVCYGYNEDGVCIGYANVEQIANSKYMSIPKSKKERTT